MNAHRDYLEIIAGRRTDLTARVVRTGLTPLSFVYEGIIRIRNRRYDRPGVAVRLPVPVISIGNITTGGTGKTPMVVKLCHMLTRCDVKPVVLTRGYKASPSGESDEAMLIRERCPGVNVVVNPDRVAGGRDAIAHHRPDVLVLDDGFQHRRLARDLDLVLVDARCPFGYDQLLPRGLLREPVSSLRRAHAIIITRGHEVNTETRDAIEVRLREIVNDVPILHAEHEMSDLQLCSAKKNDSARSARLGAFAGIGQPESFRHLLHREGYRIEDGVWFPDHHAYTSKDVEQLIAWARQNDLKALVTTRKDAVKLSRFSERWPLPVWVMDIDLALTPQDESVLARLLDQVVQESGTHE